MRKAVEKGAESAIEKVGAQMVATARKNLWPGHGVLTGAMRDSIHFVVASDGKSGELVNPKDYGPNNEFGHAPHMRPAAEQAQRDFPEAMGDLFKGID